MVPLVPYFHIFRGDRTLIDWLLDGSWTITRPWHGVPATTKKDFILCGNTHPQHSMAFHYKRLQKWIKWHWVLRIRKFPLSTGSSFVDIWSCLAARALPLPLTLFAERPHAGTVLAKCVCFEMFCVRSANAHQDWSGQGEDILFIAFHYDFHAPIGREIIYI